MCNTTYRECHLNPKRDEPTFGGGFLSGEDAIRFHSEESSLYRFSVILSGAGLLIDEDLKPYPLAPGCVIQHAPGRTYTVFQNNGAQEPWSEFAITLNALTAQALSTVVDFHGMTPVFTVTVQPVLREWMDDLDREIHTLSQDMLLEIFFQAQRFVLTFQMEEDRSDFAFALAVIRFTCNYTVGHLASLISIRELANACQISYGRLNAIFKTYVRDTPLKYLQHYKFNHASRLLTTGSSIQEVASMLGYSDQFSFSKQFKRIMGVSPSAVRRQAFTPSASNGARPG